MSLEVLTVMMMQRLALQNWSFASLWKTVNEAQNG